MSNSNGSFKNAGNTIFRQPTSTSWTAYVLLLLITAFLILLLLFLIQYLRSDCPPPGKIPFWNYFTGMDPTGDACIPKPPEVQYDIREEKLESEPWLLEDQIYTFPEAKMKCKAYGAELANYHQLVSAYNDGMHAPLYGWTQGARAYQVMDPCQYDKLISRGENPAPPGVQGGQFPEYTRFGTWCYGVRPKGSVIREKSNRCPLPSLCQRNPDACVPLKSDKIAPFFPEKRWSMWGDTQQEE